VIDSAIFEWQRNWPLDCILVAYKCLCFAQAASPFSQDLPRSRCNTLIVTEAAR
jgi:hypothetical protein